MTYPTNQEIARINRIVMKELSDFGKKDDALVDSCITEIKNQLIRINQFGNGNIEIDHAFLYTLALRKLYAVANETRNETAKEKVVELMIFRLRTNPDYANSKEIDYFNAPLITILTVTMGNDDLFEHEPYSILKKRAEDKITSERNNHPNQGFFAKRNRRFPPSKTELAITYVDSCEGSPEASPTDNNTCRELPIDDPSSTPRF